MKRRYETTLNRYTRSILRSNFDRKLALTTAWKLRNGLLSTKNVHVQVHVQCVWYRNELARKMTRTTTPNMHVHVCIFTKLKVCRNKTRGIGENRDKAMTALSYLRVWFLTKRIQFSPTRNNGKERCRRDLFVKFIGVCCCSYYRARAWFHVHRWSWCSGYMKIYRYLQLRITRCEDEGCPILKRLDGIERIFQERIGKDPDGIRVEGRERERERERERVEDGVEVDGKRGKKKNGHVKKWARWR